MLYLLQRDKTKQDRSDLMALIKCPECGKEISDKSPACIHCGYPVAKREKTTTPKNFNKYSGQNNGTIKEPYVGRNRGENEEKTFFQRNATLLIMLVVFLLLIIIGLWWVALFFVLPIIIAWGVKKMVLSPLSPDSIDRTWNEEGLYDYRLTCPRCRSKNFKRIKSNKSMFMCNQQTFGEGTKKYECSDCKYRW